MNLNKMGMQVKKNMDVALNTLLRIMTNLKPERSKLLNGTKLTENSYFEKESERILLETEVKKSQAIALVHGLQEC